MEKKQTVTQIKTIADHLKKWGAITSWEAFKHYGITRLSAHIWTLRHNYGWGIDGNRATKKNRYGHPCTYSVYTLKEAGGDVD